MSRACTTSSKAKPGRHISEPYANTQRSRFSAIAISMRASSRLRLRRLGRPPCACAPKSGAAVSCPASMMPRRMARASVNSRNSVSPSPKRMARCSSARSSEKRPSISSTASLLLRNTSRHMVGSEAAMRVKSRKPPAENLITSEFGHALQMGGRVDDVVGDEVRQVARHRQHHVVVLGAHDLDLGAQRLPERLELVDGGRIGPRRRRQDGPAPVEQLGEARLGARLLGAGNGVPRHEVHAFGHVRGHVAHDGSLHRADVGDDRARLAGWARSPQRALRTPPPAPKG